jgi:hypothetical protein
MADARDPAAVFCDWLMDLELKRIDALFLHTEDARELGIDVDELELEEDADEDR